MSRLFINKTGKSNDYKERRTVKAVILNISSNETLLISDILIGGGVEKGETYKKALEREIIEEAGIQVKVIKHLGSVVQYRQFLKKKYLIQGYLCQYVSTISRPTTLDKQELILKRTWVPVSDAIDNLKTKISELQNSKLEIVPTDLYQARLFNRQMALFFLEKTLSIINKRPI